MKRDYFGLTKRILAAVMCLAMLLAFLPAQAAQAAQSKTYTVIAGSDFQYDNADHGIAGGQVRNILASIKKQSYQNYDGFLFCGDYSQSYTAAASKEGLAYLKNVVSEELPSIPDDHKFFLQGNHDVDSETTDGTLNATGAYETEGYSVYVINEKDYMWYNDDEATIKTTAANLRSYLNAKCRAEDTKPIFIMSHMQLHYSMRTYTSGDGKYANYLFDVINEAAGNGLNIIFLFGHNHSNGWDDYLGGAACFLNKGDSILIGQSSSTQFKEYTLNFTYMNAGYVGYYKYVNTGADDTLTMTAFEITDDQVTISRYSADGVHNLKSKGVTNSYKNETAYSPDERVLPSPQTVVLNKEINSTSISGGSVTGEGITSYEVLVGASQKPQGYTAYQNYQISAQGYTDGQQVTVTLPIDSGFDSSRPVLVLDHQRGKTVPVMASGDKVTFTAEHMGSFTLAQSDAKAVSSSGTVGNYFRTVQQGESAQDGVPYVITDSKVTGTSHWVLTGTAVTKSVSSVSCTGLALEEVADANTSPVWYLDNGYLRFGSADGPYLNISYTGTYDGDSTASLVTIGDYDASTTAKVSVFSTGPSRYMGVSTSEGALYLAHRNSGSNSIAATYSKYNYNSALWYLNEVVSSATLTVTPSHDTVTLKNTVLLTPSVTAGSGTATNYVINWETSDPAVATVSSEGILTPVAPGQVTVKATLASLEGNAVEGISVELPITVVAYTKTDSTFSAQTRLLHQRGEQEAPVAGQTYLISFYSGGWYLTGSLLHKGDAGYNGLKDKEGMMVAETPTIPNDIWYYDGTNLYSGTQYDADRCLIYENGMVTLGAVTENNQAFTLEASSYGHLPYIKVDAGRLNHYGGKPYNVASLYNGNNYMCFYKVIPEQQVALNVTSSQDVLYAGQSFALTAEALCNGASTSDYTILWTSSDLCVATVDGQGVVRAQDGGEAVITATLTGINGSPLFDTISVEIPIQVVKEQESQDSVSAQMTLERSLQSVTELENGKAYVISSCLRSDWVWSEQFGASGRDAGYTGVILEDLDLNGGLTQWYYVEQEVDGVVRQYLRCGNVEDDANYLVCNNRFAQLGTVEETLFDTVEPDAAKGRFRVYYSPTARYLHQLGGKNYNTAIPTSHYTTDTGSYWYFNTLIPGGALKLELNKPSAGHGSLTQALNPIVTLDGAAISDYKLEWTSADDSIASVSGGVITAVASGSTQINASVTTVNGKKLATPLTVSVPLTVDAHSYEAETTAPDCTNGGHTTYTCTVCGDSYVANETGALGHSYKTVVTDPDCTTAGYTTYTCTVCGNSYVSDETAALGHSYKTVVTDPDCTNAGYTTYTCTVCGNSYVSDETASLGHSYKTVVTAPSCTNAGYTTYTCTACGDSYVADRTDALNHSYKAVVTAPTCTEIGYTTYTCDTCGNSYVSNQTTALGHSYKTVTVDATCTAEGSITKTCSGCGDTKVEVIPATGHKYTAKVTAPTCTAEGYTTYTCACGDSYVANKVAALGHSYKTVTVDATCTADGSVTDTCSVCGDTKVEVIPATGHKYTSKVTAPTCTAEGYTTYTCACGNSYVADKVAALGHSYKSVTVNATCTADGSVTDTCSVCGDTKVEVIPATGHSFAEGICGICGEADPDYVKPVVKPTLKLKAPALEFKDMIKVIAFFTAENLDDVVEMGMITYTSKVDVVDISTAAHVIPGATFDPSSNRYFASSQGIHAKYLGDTVYLSCYAKLSDGSYVYTSLASYSALTYAKNQLDKSTDVKLKQLCAAMLNYGAAAQNYFGYNTDVLANSTLTAEQIALPEAYTSGMVQTVSAVDKAKQGAFASNKGFGTRKPAVSFEGAFSINYFFTPSYTPVDGITLYYWTEADFAAADVLTVENASGAVAMKDEGTQFRGDIEGIAAKDLAKAVYVAAVYSDGTTTWTSGVLGYSIGAYCSSQANGTGTMAELAKATAVYGYHANAYFAQ